MNIFDEKNFSDWQLQFSNEDIISQIVSSFIKNYKYNN